MLKLRTCNNKIASGGLASWQLGDATTFGVQSVQADDLDR
jgi:hypothetical protein